ncbi:unnamed protein product [Mytilus edulis]|uniref:Tyr recombinase domain-containing protein n=1 Tax=Mytilus edulis TaxID=6550 RepID=A0A8S3RAS7_MYTED|nr:unnamed protein product [Mytilus edulis]
MHATTPINVDKLAWELQRHPDRYFVNSLINGLRKGFFTGVSSLPEKVLECKNLLSTTKCPDDVSGLVKSELDNNFVIGPFTKAPFDIYRVSPVGIVEDHQNADATMKILVSMFASLDFPIAKHKTLGPVTCIEYSGIILDTIRMEARLPEDKLCGSKEYLWFFLNRKTCTKHGPFSSTVSDSISGTLSLPAPLRNSVELSCVINNLWRKGINSATRDVYTSGYKCFLKFRTSQFEGENIGNVMSNISEDILICFVSYCQSVLGLKYSTIKLYLAGIRHFSIANCSVNPLVDNVGKPLLRLQNILNGIKKSENKSVRQKLPITYSVLQQIYQHLQKSIFDPHLDFTMLTAAVIGFFGFLRCSEFTCKQSFDPALNLTMDDVVFVTDCQVNLRLKASKTDIFRHGVIIKLFKTNNNICPYVQLSKYVTSRKMNGATDNDPLLVDSSNLALRRSLFIDKLKTILSHLGLNADKYSGHSFRIGAATTCSSNGIQDHMIQTLGRWKSDCYSRYIRTSEVDIRQALLKMCK